MSHVCAQSTGCALPSFDDLRHGTPQTESIQNYEIGYRVQPRPCTPTSISNDRQFSGVPFQQYVTTPAGSRELVFSYGVDSKGMDFTGRWEPIRH